MPCRFIKKTIVVLTISTTKLFLAEISTGNYNFHRWTGKPAEDYSVNKKQTCKPLELHTIMKTCNGTGLVLKICETKNNVWKKHNKMPKARIYAGFRHLLYQIALVWLFLWAE